MVKRLSSSHLVAVAFSLLIVATFSIYANSLKGPFIWDDQHFIQKNSAVRSIEKVPQFFTSKETFSLDGDFHIYRPLRNVSYLIDYLLYGVEPFGYRLANLLLHVQNIIMVACLARFLTASWFVSIFSAALFAFHPVQTEAVSWVKGRDDLLATFFYLSSLALYIMGRKRESISLYMGSVAVFLLALFSKESAVTLPFLIVLYDLFFPKNTQRKSSYHPYFYILLIYALLRTTVLGRVGQTEYWGGNFLSAYYTNLTGMVYYLKILFFPVNLCADYLMFPVRTSLFDSYVLAALLVIVTILTIAVYAYLKGWRAFAFSVAWFFITLLPVSNLVPIKIIIAERFLYGPSIGIFIGSAIIISEIGKKIGVSRKRFSLLLGAAVLSMLAVMTVDRNRVWIDEHRFWLDVAAKSPGNTRAWHNIGTIFQNKKMFHEAVSHYKTALMMDYHSPETHFQLGRVYVFLQDKENALNEFMEALKDDPENADIHYEIAFLLAGEGARNEAIGYYRKALLMEPDHVNALYNLGMLYMRGEEYDMAVRQFRRLTELDPMDKMAEGFFRFCLRKAEGAH